MTDDRAVTRVVIRTRAEQIAHTVDLALDDMAAKLDKAADAYVRQVKVNAELRATVRRLENELAQING